MRKFYYRVKTLKKVVSLFRGLQDLSFIGGQSCEGSLRVGDGASPYPFFVKKVST